MGSIFGKAIKISLFGESHGPAVGVVVDGLPPGLKVDMEYISRQMQRRRGFGCLEAPRKEADLPEFLSGVKDGFTQGTPLAIVVKNTDSRPEDYVAFADIPRPSHADYTAKEKYLGFSDISGGGHFSARLTAPIVAAGAILMQALSEKGISINTEISRLGGQDISDSSQIENMVKDAKNAGDSIGGVLKTTVEGLQAGFGEPWFNSIESEIAHAIFSIPAVKGIEFGDGFSAADMPGSQANDPFDIQNGKVITTKNGSGGIQGGISNGMPVVFRTAFKPTPSISKPQQSVNLKTMQTAELTVDGRHDPAAVLRAPAIVDALTAIVISDFIARRFGYMALRSDK